MFGKVGAGKRLSDGVVADVGKFAKAVEQAERLQNGGVNTYADSGVAGLDPLQSRTRGEGALSDDRHWQPPPAPGVTNVRSKLSQSSSNGGGRVMGRRHMMPSYYIFAQYVVRRAQFVHRDEDVGNLGRRDDFSIHATASRGFQASAVM